MRNGYLFMVILLIAVGLAGCSKPATPPASTLVEVPAAAQEEAAAAEPAPEPVTVVGNEPEPAVGEEEPTVMAAVEGGVPKLVVPEPEFNFGKVDNSETVDAYFELRNEGTGLLKIENVRASCGCTATELDKDELAPGESVKIHAATNLRGRQGPQTKAVSVMTNDPETPTVQLRIVGEAIASISVDPMRIQWGRVADDNPREETITIASNKEDITFKVLSAEIDGMDFLEHEIKEIEAGRKYELVVKTVDALPEGNHNGRFIVRTDNQERAVIWLPVSLQVVGALQISPPTINIRLSEDPTEVEQQQISISAGRASEFVITDVDVPLDSIEYELIEAAPNNYRLRLANLPRSEELEDKVIILHTNLDEAAEVVVPFNLYRPRLRQIPTPPPQALQQLQRPPAGVEDVADAPGEN